MSNFIPEDLKFNRRVWEFKLVRQSKRVSPNFSFHRFYLIARSDVDGLRSLSGGCCSLAWASLALDLLHALAIRGVDFSIIRLISLIKVHIAFEIVFLVFWWEGLVLINALINSPYGCESSGTNCFVKIKLQIVRSEYLTLVWDSGRPGLHHEIISVWNVGLALNLRRSIVQGFDWLSLAITDLFFALFESIKILSSSGCVLCWHCLASVNVELDWSSAVEGKTICEWIVCVCKCHCALWMNIRAFGLDWRAEKRVAVIHSSVK